MMGAIADGCPSSIMPYAKSDKVRSPWVKRSKLGKSKRVWKWTMPIWAYKYDGSFFKDHRYIEIEIVAEKPDENIVIGNLNAYPM